MGRARCKQIAGSAHEFSVSLIVLLLFWAERVQETRSFLPAPGSFLLWWDGVPLFRAFGIELHDFVLRDGESVLRLFHKTPFPPWS
jgi:hypothetical protein